MKRIFCISNFIQWGTFMVFYATMSQYLFSLGYSKSQVAYCFVLPVGVGVTISLLLNPYLTRKLGVKKHLRYGYVASAALALAIVHSSDIFLVMPFSVLFCIAFMPLGSQLVTLVTTKAPDDYTYVRSWGTIGAASALFLTFVVVGMKGPSGWGYLFATFCFVGFLQFRLLPDMGNDEGETSKGFLSELKELKDLAIQVLRIPSIRTVMLLICAHGALENEFWILYPDFMEKVVKVEESWVHFATSMMICAEFLIILSLSKWNVQKYWKFAITLGAIGPFIRFSCMSLYTIYPEWILLGIGLGVHGIGIMGIHVVAMKYIAELTERKGDQMKSCAMAFAVFALFGIGGGVVSTFITSVVFTRFDEDAFRTFCTLMACFAFLTMVAFFAAFRPTATGPAK